MEDIKNIEDMLGSKNAVPIELSFFGSYKLELFCSGQVLSGLSVQPYLIQRLTGYLKEFFKPGNNGDSFCDGVFNFFTGV
jgi:hypothetical protein